MEENFLSKRSVTIADDLITARWLRGERQSEMWREEVWLARGDDLTLGLTNGEVEDGEDDVDGVEKHDFAVYAQEIREKREAEEDAADLAAIIDAICAGVWIPNSPMRRKIGERKEEFIYRMLEKTRKLNNK